MSRAPRILPPERGNPYYIYKDDGGLNPAHGNSLRRNRYLTALPNCVAIYGWFNEIGGEGQKYLAKAWYPYAVIAAAKREGLTVTQEPKIGGIMVWTGGKNGDGHVEGCGDVFDDETILGVGSEYYGQDWVAFQRKKGDGNWRTGCPWMDSSYTYQGCINNPYMKEEDMTKAETEQLVREMFPDLIATYLANLAKKPASNKETQRRIDSVIKAGLMGGDPSGSFRPQSPMKREELAIVLYNMLPEK